MQKSKFSDTQIVSILQGAEAGIPVKEVCRQHQISSACYYKWKSKFDGLSVSELRRNRELEAENSKLKRMYAEMAMENHALQRREAVKFLRTHHWLSIRKACANIGLSRSAWYRPLVDWTEPDHAVAEALSALADSKPGLGFWKLFSRLRRMGHAWNHQRVYRVYCRLNLNLRRRTKQRVPVRDPLPLFVPDAPNRVWSADFMSNALYNGVRLVRVFEQLKRERGLPDILRTDNGPEFLGEVFVSWCRKNGVMLDYIEPGKPNQNAFIERFNRSYRSEVLSTWLFRNLDEVREITWAWMLEYNEERDHDGLGGLTPAEVLANAKVSTLEWPT